ncbi:Cyclin-dependent kinase B2-1 [Senna tora]|uniref:Cyclin-dependent kinase B2-1 n=1 Tax=Senna tora TaxID=362788 RepID=A0A834SYB3_9FABA|nr:Cyclin-dependent kinase B2-1 [Senna tora]
MGIPREHAQNGNLTESGRRDAFFVLVETSLLEGNDLASRLLSCSVNLSVRPFSNLLKLLECILYR